MTRIAIVLEFDTDGDEHNFVTREEIESYAAELNLKVAQEMSGYEGWRVEDITT
jgi:hypothetical protein